MNADGTVSEPDQRLADDGEPSWSPDGTKIAFTRTTATTARSAS